MANPIRRLVELVLDRASADKTKKGAQQTLKEGTDPKVAQRNLSVVERSLGKVRDAVGRVGGAFKASARVIAQAAASVAGYALALTKAIERGGEVIGVQRAFARVVGDTDAAIAKLRETTSGLISDYDLMVGFNRALTLGAARTIDDFGEISGVALDLGKALGVDATFAMESLTLGIGRGSKLILDNLGIIVDGAITVENVMVAARKRIAELGGAVDDGSSSVARWKVQIKNLRDEVAAFLAQSNTLRIAFEEGANIVETIVLALQTRDRATIVEVFKLTGTFAGAAFSGAFFDAVRVAFRSVSDLITPAFLEKHAQFVPVLGVFKAMSDLAAEASESAWASVDAQVEALGALGRAIESSRKSIFPDAEGDFLRAMAAAAAAAEAAAAAAEEAAKKRREEEDKRLAHLIEARELEVATREETMELVRLHAQVNAALEVGNLKTEDRIRLQQRLNAIESAVPALASIGRRLPPGPPDLVDNARLLDDEGERIRLDRIRNVQAEVEHLRDTWLDANADIQAASERAALGVAGAYQDAFEAMLIEGQGVAGFMEAIFRGTAASALGALADIASAKVVENIARAFEAMGLGFGQLLTGNIAAPAVAGQSAAFHFASAAKWAVLGGAAGAVQGAVAGGGRGGVSGGLSSGARDPVGRSVDRRETLGPEVHIHFEGPGFEATNPTVQRVVLGAERAARERYGENARVRVHRSG